MNISSQIRSHRKLNHLSQDELAEKIFVSRQTISNWETGKSYPDIHNLLLLSDLFRISIDELIKGDVEIMKEKIQGTTLNRLGQQMLLYFLLMSMTLPLVRNVSRYFFTLTILFAGLMILAAFRAEKLKKDLDIKTYREIVDYMEGNPVERTEEGTRNRKLLMENILKVLLGLAAGGTVAYILLLLF